MATHIALLRGLNLAKYNRLRMTDLAAAFAEAGATDVRTYIQSGNVIFRARSPAAVGAQVERTLAERFAVRSPVILRSADELEAVLESHPLARPGIDEKQLCVGFLAARPTAARVAALDASRSPPDELLVRGREVYLRFPNGVGKSRLTADWFDRQLATTITVRYWRVVCALAALARE